MDASQISDYFPFKDFPKILDECAIVYSFTMFSSSVPFAKTILYPASHIFILYMFHSKEYCAVLSGARLKWCA